MQKSFALLALMVSPAFGHVVEHCPAPSEIVRENNTYAAPAQDNRYDWFGFVSSASANQGDVTGFDNVELFRTTTEYTPYANLAHCEYRLEKGTMMMTYSAKPGTDVKRLEGEIVEHDVWDKEEGLGGPYYVCTRANPVDCSFRVIEPSR